MFPVTDKLRLSRRRRRVLWTAVLLVIGVTAAAFALLRAYRQRQGAEYRPGEANPDITQSLAQGLPPGAPKPVLVDVTKEAGLDGFVTFAGARGSQLPEDMGPGVAWGDFDNDGDDDLFLVSAGGPLSASTGKLAPSLLFENAGGGRFRRVDSFPETRIHGMGAAWGDYDGDGWQDLVVTGYDALLLFHNDRGRLTADARFASRKGFWSGAAWGDYDNDGRLDLYICGYVKYVPSDAGAAQVSEQYGTAVPFTLNPASFDPERNLLFHNKGGGAFEESGAKLRVENPTGRSLSAIWHDFDGDGWLDLYVANDISDNVFFHNVKGKFEEISHAAWVADYRGAMGLAVGDWNRDGDDDLFITHWLAQENALYDSMLKDTGGLKFTDAADTFGLGQIALPVVGWGTEFFDFDSDGWLDLIAVNGSTIETGDRPKKLKPQLPFLLWNRHGEYFHDLAPASPPLAQPHVARGLAVSDFDSDGDLDVAIMRSGEGVQLLRNDTAHGHWVEVVLKARPAAGGPLQVARGAVAIAQAGKATLRRAVSSASYLSQSTAVLHFGLGEATSIDRLEVRWRGASVSTYGPLAADKRWEITEGESAPTEKVAGSVAASGSERERVAAFWDRQRAGMQALKVEKNLTKAIALFREALALDPTHEDARYYLATCLAAQGNTDAALAEYETLTRGNPRSHRGFAAWGTLRAATARSAGDLAAAETALTKAHDLNPEETGALLTLGEVALLRGQAAVAEQRFKAVCQTNARATGGLFLLGYLQWKRGDAIGAKDRLQRARAALGPDWKPKGATAEGDVQASLSESTTPLSRFWEQWDGAATVASAYRPLDTYLRRTTGAR
jgi:tetratricopeptide (TPR) repeat protein